MKTLPTQLKIHGFTLTQLLREGDVALYRQNKPGRSSVAYEVVKVLRHGKKSFATRNPDGSTVMREIEEGEYYPSTSEWGSRGWTFRDEESARAKVRSLIPA